MQKVAHMNQPTGFSKFFGRLEGPYWVMLGLYAILVVAALILDSPQNIVAGIREIFISRSVLVTDYAALAGMGAMLVSSVLVGTFSLITMVLGGVKPSGGTLMGLFLILGFGFFGKNLINTIPIVSGVWLFAKYKDMPFRDVAVTTMMCASVAPIVSEIAYLMPMAQPAGAIIGALSGVFIGFIFAPMASAMGKVHGGYLLYNAGFVGGLIATFVLSLLRSGGFVVTPAHIWALEYDLPLAILMYVVSAFFIVVGIMTSGKDRWEQMKKVQKHSGRLLTDYYSIYGGIAYLNIGLLCALATTVTLLVGAPINGATMGGIFCVAGFGALGKNFRNVLPIMIGTTLGAYWNHNDLTAPSNILAILFGTGIAPLAGQWGIMWGIICGFVHVSVVSFVGLINGGMNLYNNGFAGGLVVIVMVPIMSALSKKNAE